MRHHNLMVRLTRDAWLVKHVVAQTRGGSNKFWVKVMEVQNIFDAIASIKVKLFEPFKQFDCLTQKIFGFYFPFISQVSLTDLLH